MDLANHIQNVHKLFLKAGLEPNDCPFVCIGKFLSQIQIGVNGINFFMASNLDVI